MTEAGNNPNCGTCKGTGRIEAYPDANIYAPCDECRPEDLKMWNAGYKAALADPDTVVVPLDTLDAIAKLRKYFGKPVGITMQELGRDAFIDLSFKVRIGDLMDYDAALAAIEKKEG
jgi:hypothetical protein